MESLRSHLEDSVSNDEYEKLSFSLADISQKYNVLLQKDARQYQSSNYDEVKHIECYNKTT